MATPDEPSVALARIARAQRDIDACVSLMWDEMPTLLGAYHRVVTAADALRRSPVITDDPQDIHVVVTVQRLHLAAFDEAVNDLAEAIAHYDAQVALALHPQSGSVS